MGLISRVSSRTYSFRKLKVEMSKRDEASTGKNRSRPDREYDKSTSKKSRISNESSLRSHFHRIFINHTSKNTVVAKVRQEVEKFGDVVNVVDGGLYTSSKTGIISKKFWTKSHRSQSMGRSQNKRS